MSLTKTVDKSMNLTFLVYIIYIFLNIKTSSNVAFLFALSTYDY